MQVTRSVGNAATITKPKFVSVINKKIPTLKHQPLNQALTIWRVLVLRPVEGHLFSICCHCVGGVLVDLDGGEIVLFVLSGDDAKLLADPAELGDHLFLHQREAHGQDRHTYSLNIFICINVYAMGLGYKLLQHYQWPSPKIITKQWHSISRYIQMVMQQNSSGSRYNIWFWSLPIPIHRICDVMVTRVHELHDGAGWDLNMNLVHI